MVAAMARRGAATAQPAAMAVAAAMVAEAEAAAAVEVAVVEVAVVEVAAAANNRTPPMTNLLATTQQRAVAGGA
jgi:hypothetical protein